MQHSGGNPAALRHFFSSQKNFTSFLLDLKVVLSGSIQSECVTKRLKRKLIGLELRVILSFSAFLQRIRNPFVISIYFLKKVLAKWTQFQSSFQMMLEEGRPWGWSFKITTTMPKPISLQLSRSMSVSDWILPLKTSWGQMRSLALGAISNQPKFALLLWQSAECPRRPKHFGNENHLL